MLTRLAKENINTAEEYDRIYSQRKEFDSQELRRFSILYSKYKGGGLIDLGCLDSPICGWAKTDHPRSEVYGLDQAEDCISSMNEKYPDIDFLVGDVYQTLFPNSFFDYIVAGELIEHLSYPQKFFNEALRILKKGGILSVSTPNNEAIEPGAVDSERHLWSFEEKDIKQLIGTKGKVKSEILSSQMKPYEYHFPTLICHVKKR